TDVLRRCVAVTRRFRLRVSSTLAEFILCLRRSRCWRVLAAGLIEPSLQPAPRHAGVRPRIRPGASPRALRSPDAVSSRLRKKRMTTALLFSTRCARGPLSEWKDAQEPSRAADCGPRRDRPRRAETVPGRSRALGREGSNPDQVVRGEGKCKHPVHAAGAPVPRLAHQPDGFEPAEDLLHSLAPLLADRVARMPSGSIVNRAAAAMAGVLGDMWGHSEQAHRRD